MHRHEKSAQDSGDETDREILRAPIFRVVLESAESVKIVDPNVSQAKVILSAECCLAAIPVFFFVMCGEHTKIPPEHALKSRASVFIF